MSNELERLAQATVESQGFAWERDTRNRVMARLGFAGITGTEDPATVRTIVKESLATAKRLTKQANGMERTASYSVRSCPRCSSGMTPVKLADAQEADFCPTCRATELR